MQMHVMFCAAVCWTSSPLSENALWLTSNIWKLWTLLIASQHTEEESRQEHHRLKQNA